MMEQLLGTKISRNEVSTGKGRRRVVYEIATLGVREEGAAAERKPIRPVSEKDGEQGRLF